MLTARGFWFFLITFTVLGLAVYLGATQLTLVGATLLLWFLGQWLLFNLRVRLAIRRLAVTRTLTTTRGRVDTVWARQKVDVAVQLTNGGWVGLPYLIITDRLPALAGLQDGSLRADGALPTDIPIQLEYTLTCASPGRLRFEGVKVELADVQGFFTFVTFVRNPREYRVLPALAVDAAQAPFVKQHNVLPLLGTHRLARPGGSSELLDLRDYLVGDPPKLIAWKVSARRDRLITRVFESEVPIRCTLFLDASSSVCVGPVGATALCRLVEIATGVAQANASERDLTGLCVFSDAGVEEVVRPARGASHVLKLLDILTRVANRMARAPYAHVAGLLPYAHGLAQDVYPEWLDHDINYLPFWLPPWASKPRSTRPPGAPSYWSRFSRGFHRDYRMRKELAAILSVRYNLGPGGLGLLLEDDLLCSDYLQRFLADHQVVVPFPLYNEAGRYLFAAPKKVQVLADLLLKAVTRGKDNELFVLCVDLLEISEHLAPLERAVCVARARHHQVIVVCPWPRGVETPARRPTGRARLRGQNALELQLLLQQVSTRQVHHAFARVQSAFARLGVTVLCAAQEDSVNLILHRMRRLRVQERGVR